MSAFRKFVKTRWALETLEVTLPPEVDYENVVGYQLTGMPLKVPTVYIQVKHTKGALAGCLMTWKCRLEARGWTAFEPVPEHLHKQRRELKGGDGK